MTLPDVTPLETPRLILRLPQESDWPAYRAYRLSSRSTLIGADEELAWTHFAAFFGHWLLRGFGRFIAVDRVTGLAIGHFGPFRPAGQAENELTWTLWDVAHQGRGLALEAAQAVRDHAFVTLGWPSAVSYIEPGNLRSQALAGRLGAVRDPSDGTACDVWRHHPQGTLE